MKEVTSINLVKNEINTQPIERSWSVSLTKCIDYLYSLFPINQEIIKSKTRKREIVDVKRVINYCLFNTRRWSNSDIGVAMGYNHSWVNYHLKKLSELLQTNAKRDFIPMINYVQSALKELNIA